MKVLSPISSSSIRSACAVCGFSEIRTDAVFDGRWVLLSECPRCSHRATLSLAPPTKVMRAGLREAPAAA
jgi:hypothetical protein